MVRLGGAGIFFGIAGIFFEHDLSIDLISEKQRNFMCHTAAQAFTLAEMYTNEGNDLELEKYLDGPIPLPKGVEKLFPVQKKIDINLDDICVESELSGYNDYSVKAPKSRQDVLDVLNERNVTHDKDQKVTTLKSVLEKDLRENHPYFDRPLFAVPRESRFRKICQAIVNARYDPKLKDPLSGKERKVRFKTFHKLLGLVTYLDWFMIIVTTLTTISMMFETPQYRVMEHRILQV